MTKNTKFGDIADILGLVAAAGTAALFIRHETGPKPFLKTKMQLVAVALGGAAVAAIAMTKSLSEGPRMGDKFSVIGMLAGAFLIGSAYTLSERMRADGRTLTSGGPDIFKAQLGLLRLGYPVSTNGQLDTATREALKRVQATYTLGTQDGSLTLETAAYIDQAVHSMSQQQPFSADVGYHPQPVSQI